MAAAARHDVKIPAYDDSGGDGPLVLLLPGAGDLRSEHRFLAPELVARGYRVVSADLPGHGESPPAARYGVSETAAAITALIDHLGGGPAVVIGCSFAPAAAVWAVSDAPASIRGLVLISPHLTGDHSATGRLQRIAIKAAMAGPWAGALWKRLLRSWYTGRVPDDFDAELERVGAMLATPAGRRAVRDTVVASREGMAAKIKAVHCPALVVFGTADDHFTDPRAEASAIAAQLGAESVLVEDAGHYPHVERSDVVAPAVIAFLERLG